MKLIGLAGPLRVGKDTVAAYLVRTHNFLQFSFSDALYREVRRAFGRPDDDIVVHPQSAVKEVKLPELALNQCDSEDFRRAVAEHELGGEVHQRDYHAFLHLPRSPREILQLWGTEYRRKQDPDYWVKQAKAFSDAFLERAQAGESLGISGLVNSSVRFENERRWIKSEGGEIWHIRRRVAELNMDRSHEAERGLPVEAGEKEFFNNGPIERLGTAVTILLSTPTRSMFTELA